jgi:deoxyribodipyrimidine photo-lyase
LKFYKQKGPDNERSSKLSPYLHFGQISPLEILYEVDKINEFLEEKESFLEEVIIRRELAINFVYYNSNYDNWKGITYNWAYETLEKHKEDLREYIYTENELENGKTHDKYWNACQKQMVKTGYMEGYMRMYWCKKILEWSESPQEAYEITLKLNNKYFYDGRDPNSYAGVAWCFGKHDRAWKERRIFGKVRYMNSDGLERKFKMEKYLEKYLK